MNELVKKLLIAQDKANHFIYSLLLSLLFFILLIVANRVAEGNLDVISLACIAGVTSFAVGIYKESVDYYTGKGTASWLDLLADILGIGTFVIIVYLVNVLK